MKPVMYRTAGHPHLPSPSIWADCNRADIIDMGTGYWFHEEFLGGVVADTAVDGFQFYGTASTVAGTNSLGGILYLGCAANDNDDAYISKEPFCRIVLGSGNRVWVEAKFAPVYMGADDTGVVFGLGEADFLVADAVADACADLIGQSFVGFRLLDGNTDSIDAIYQLDAGAEVSILADVTEATALGDDAAALTSGDFHKYGMRFDGDKTLYCYVDGIIVSKTVIPAATFPVGVDMGVILGLKSGTTDARYLYIDWVRGAYERETH